MKRKWFFIINLIPSILMASMLVSCKEKLSGKNLNNQLRSDPPYVFWTNPILPLPESVGVMQDAIQIGIDHAVNQPVSIDYTVNMGTTDASDHTLSSGQGTITFNPGETLKSLPMTIFNDQIPEPQETMTITLGVPSFGQVIGNDVTTVMILEDPDDIPTVHWQVPQIDFPEEPSLERYEVFFSLDRPSAFPVTVNLSIGNIELPSTPIATNNVDYRVWDGNTQLTPFSNYTVTFQPFEVMKSIDFQPIYQFLQEGTEGITITMSNAQNANLPDEVSHRKVHITIDDNNATLLPLVRFETFRTAVVEGLSSTVRLVSSIPPVAATGPIRARVQVKSFINRNGVDVCRRTAFGVNEVTHSPAVYSGTDVFDLVIPVGQTISNTLTMYSDQDAYYERANGPQEQKEREDYCFEIIEILDGNATINLGLNYHRFETFDNDPMPYMKIMDQYPFPPGVGNLIGLGPTPIVTVWESVLGANLQSKFPIRTEWVGLSDLVGSVFWCKVYFTDISSSIDPALPRATPNVDYTVNTNNQWQLNSLLANWDSHVPTPDDSCKDSFEWEHFKVRLNTYQNPNITNFQYCRVRPIESERDVFVAIRDNEWFTNTGQCDPP